MTSISIFHLNPSTRNTKRRPAFESTVGEGFSTNLALDTQSKKEQSIFTEKEKDLRQGVPAFARPFRSALG